MNIVILLIVSSLHVHDCRETAGSAKVATADELGEMDFLPNPRQMGEIVVASPQYWLSIH